MYVMSSAELEHIINRSTGVRRRRVVHKQQHIGDANFLLQRELKSCLFWGKLPLASKTDPF